MTARMRPALAALLATLALALVAGCGSAAAPSTTGSTTGTGGADDASGVPLCVLEDLPDEAKDTVAEIHDGPPYDYPRNDGVTFGNREGLLPAKPQGYYREYTVPTPGSDDRGARRIVTGGNPATDPPELYYTGDHYDSFCRLTGF